MGQNGKFAILTLCFFALAVTSALGSTVGYTTLSSFQSATMGLTTQGFDTATAGTVISNGGGDGLSDGLTFNYDINGGAGLLEVVALFPTTSSPNYLGSDDPTTGAFFASDSLTITLPQSVTAFGLYIVGNPSFDANTFTLSTTPGSAQNSATPDVTIDAYGDVGYFLGLTSATPFTSATIALTTPGGTGDGPLWNVDDVTWGNLKSSSTVPEPSSLVLLIGGGLAAGLRRLRKLA